MIQLLNGIENIGELLKNNLKFEKISLTVDSSGKSVRFSQFTQVDTKKIVGIAITSSDDDAILGATLQLTMRAIEIFPRDFEAKMLLCGQEVPPNQRFFIFNKAIDVDRSEITGTLVDGGAGFYSAEYNVNIYLLGFEG
jgi:hypothetical protein